MVSPENSKKNKTSNVFFKKITFSFSCRLPPLASSSSSSPDDSFGGAVGLGEDGEAGEGGGGGGGDPSSTVNLAPSLSSAAAAQPNINKNGDSSTYNSSSR